MAKITQSTITCSKLTIEALEQGVKYVSKLKIKTQERRQRRVFIVKFEHISNLVLLFLLLILSRQIPAGKGFKF